ncbi:hypothetical protein [Limnospira platensis]|uniref:hypothetical protein n=1 Tax=Limnospira platensis TaxID=118562 RepID=UPI001923FDCF
MSQSESKAGNSRSIPQRKSQYSIIQHGGLKPLGRLWERVTAIATPSFRIHNPGIEAGNGRREVEPTTKNDHCQPSMTKEI